jgi:hypothetical protein
MKTMKAAFLPSLFLAFAFHPLSAASISHKQAEI